MKWSEEECEELDELVNNAWCWQFPGWKWIAEHLTARTGIKRSARACSAKDARMCDAYNRSHKLVTDKI